eukprot:TRINITY_DN42987_c0_g1_i1.p1 TRINITY_DN42987_c0_g1~~TRINITY_DN42987_c0_g1_i1.p1  ORF type:complete len:1564 (-),score=312.27 TRINITY_DN42987_c0_g1_i1:135-4268(-)
MVDVRYSDLTGRCIFEFQRLRYEVVTESVIEGSSGKFDEDDEPDCVRRVSCPIDKELKHYVTKRGLDEDDVDVLSEQYGKNMLTVAVPNFFVLYKEQILSPLVVFQLFLSILWAMDDYISFTLMQICVILMFESTTVFQRQRTMKMLNGMTIKPFDVKVFRDGVWAEVSTSDLLPGDLMQLVVDKPDPSASTAALENGGSSAPAASPGVADANAGVNVVPCDCLLLRGEAVVNEASLTGESVPQMKESLLLEDESRKLDIEGVDLIHTLSSGSSPMSTKAGEAAKTGPAASLPETPDGGCLCFVLRTGFGSAQGKLLQMIEFSSDRKAVKADEREMSMALLLLLSFALVASGYVMKKGLEKGDKTLYELVLKCVIIITSVVPRTLPMTMAMAVNTALMTLLKAGVFCTEPHRVPFAGKITHCLFDKTGTITTDTLALEGIVNGNEQAKADTSSQEVVACNRKSNNLGLEPVHQASTEASLVLGACHSLVSVEGKGLVGDPIELAGLRGAGWAFDAESAIARPCEAVEKQKALEFAQKELRTSEGRLSSAPAKEMDKFEKDVADRKALVTAAESAVEEAKIRDSEHPLESAKILQRYRFMSKLQRSCTIVSLKTRKGRTSSFEDGTYSLVKGSPEAVGDLLAEGAAPTWYRARYRDLAERGMRILALGYKKLSAKEDGEALPAREQAEQGLTFAGFIAFSCRLRSDSALVIAALLDSAHSVALVTGDSPLTALHVARETNFCSPAKTALVLQTDEKAEKVTWAVATGDSRGETRPFSSSGVSSLVKDGFDLMVTEAALRVAVAIEPQLWDELDGIRVFARMTPQGKADIIRAMQKLGSKVVMCGDGGNDMGALKQADVGIALFAGYGNVNADADAADGEASPDGAGVSTGNTSEQGTVAVVQPVMSAEDRLNADQKDLQKRSRDLQKEKTRLLKQRQGELQAKQKEWLEEELKRRENEGLPLGVMGHAAAMKSVVSRFTQELLVERKELDKKFGNVYEKKSDDPMKQLMGEVEQSDGAAAAGGMPMVRPGDASLAAAFTSRVPSIKSTVDIIRQGRCALLSALQQQQIVVLHCLINAYVLSALSLEGSRTSERQMMASSWLLNIANFAFSYARPCDKIHPVRPLRSLFQKAVFVSLFGQAIIHLGCLVYATSLAREAMEPDSLARQNGLDVGPSLADVSEFWKKQRLIRRGVLGPEEVDDEDLGFLELTLKQWMSPFLPNLMNTVVFLVETSQTVAVLAVNYKGQPWMKGLVENRPLFLSVFIVIGALAGCAWELIPQANAMIHLTPFPGDSFRIQIMMLVLISIFGTAVWDRLCVWFFSPEIFWAMWRSAMQTTFRGDVLPVITDCGKILVGVFLFKHGIPGWIALFFWYKHRKKED